MKSEKKELIQKQIDGLFNEITNQDIQFQKSVSKKEENNGKVEWTFSTIGGPFVEEDTPAVVAVKLLNNNKLRVVFSCNYIDIHVNKTSVMFEIEKDDEYPVSLIENLIKQMISEVKNPK